MNRRELLLGAPGILAGGCATPNPPTASPFQHGVASGDATATSLVLWTAVASAATSASLRWWLRRARDGVAIGEGLVEASCASGLTAKLLVEGLEPDERYEYGFALGAAASPIGRTRTLPASGDRSIRFAVFSCSRYCSGWFHAYRHAAQDNSLDFALHLGDFIYEGANAPSAETTGRLHIPAHELMSLADYRMRHAQHKSDADLQALHAAMPMFAIWDDHEFTDDASQTGANTSHPDVWPGRLAAARQAYFEWMPIAPNASGGIWRARRIGDMADLLLLDTRIEGRAAQMDPSDSAFASSERQMLGPAQEQWLSDALSAPAPRPCTLIASSVILSKLAWPSALRGHIAADAPAWGRRLLEQRIARSEQGLAGNPDAWDGYPAAQARLLNMLSNRASRTLVLSGDTHSSWAFRLRGADGAQLGWEIGVPSVTSEASLDCIAAAPQTTAALFKARNGHLETLEPSSRGYAVIELSASGASVEWRYVSSVVERAAIWRISAPMPLA